jgi:hypothetical protein
MRPVVGWSAIVLAAAMAFSLTLAACGGNAEATRSGPRILADASAAINSVKSFRMSASVSTSGGVGRFTFEVAGKGVGLGTFSLGNLQFQLEEDHATDYIKSSSLWTSVGGGALQQLLTGHWVSLPASNTLAQQLTGGLAALTSPSQTASSLTKGEPKARRAGTSNVDGEGVVVVREAGGGEVLVATQGPPYPLEFRLGNGTTLYLSDFGRTFSIRPPARSLSLLNVIAGLQSGAP